MNGPPGDSRGKDNLQLLISASRSSTGEGLADNRRCLVPAPHSWLPSRLEAGLLASVHESKRRENLLDAFASEHADSCTQLILPDARNL